MKIITRLLWWAFLTFFLGSLHSIATLAMEKDGQKVSPSPLSSDEAVVTEGNTNVPVVKPFVKPGKPCKKPAVFPGGPILKPDGSRVQPDGSTVRPDGSTIRPDGSTVKPDRSTVKTYGSTVKKE